jgi:ATP-dependent RNA helicase DDX51/DBP6
MLVTQARDVATVCSRAFSADNRRYINIGIAVGNQTLKSEQVSLMIEEVRYDPQEYRRREERLNAKWKPDEENSDKDPWEEDFALFDETLSKLPNHIIEHRPKVDILICTPGRLVEHLKSTPGFTLDYLQWLVIDEADKLLDQSFQQWLPNVISKLPKNESITQLTHTVTKVVCSATMTRDIGQLSELKLRYPRLVVLDSSEDLELKGEEQSTESLNLPATLLETAIKVVNDGEKPLYLMHLLKRIAPTAES